MCIDDRTAPAATGEVTAAACGPVGEGPSRGLGPVPRLMLALTILSVPVCTGRAWSQDARPLVDPRSPWGTDYYAQGGVVVDGIAYFTANDQCRRPGVVRTDRFPSVVAFDLATFRTLRTYPFHHTYDSSPLVYRRKDGSWVVVAHEWQKARTRALERDTGKEVWHSPANQPGMYFFGYSYYERSDGSKILFVASANGLHALCGETGRELWWLRQRTTGGVTPCVDQDNGWVYYQCDGKLFKLDARRGTVLKQVRVPAPNRCISWNTVLVNDEHGYYIATRWYGRPEWDSAIRVYDQDLRLVWERTGLPHGKKDTLTYADGLLVCGSGNSWSDQYHGDDWKYLAAYSVRDGRVVWRCDLSHIAYRDILNVPYADGYFYAETACSPPLTSKCLRIDARSGRLVEILDYGRPVTSCATHILARGLLLSGDLWQDQIVVVRYAKRAINDWPGPFGDPQTNQMAAPRSPAAELVPLRLVGPTVSAKRPVKSNLAKAARITAGGPNRVPYGSLEQLTDGDLRTWWTSGPGDLAVSPADVDLGWQQPVVVDHVELVTTRLKGRLRLTDFDLYGGIDRQWDGAEPLAVVRGNAAQRIEVRFPAVRLDRLRIRIWGTARPDNAFAHIAELAVYPAGGAPQRELRPRSFPAWQRALGEHDPKRLRELLGQAATVRDASAPPERLIRGLRRRLELAEEADRYRKRLEQITRDTRRYESLNAPRWAVAQQDAMRRLRQWAYYWIDHQQEDGQFGAGYEDDVELVCSWPVLVVAQNDQRVADALRRLADGAWHSRSFVPRYGYDRLSDVEHSAELISYGQTPMVVLEPDETRWLRRCRLSSETVARYFLGRNKQGRLQFRSDYFGIDPRTGRPAVLDEKRPFDIPEGAKALKPAVYVAWASNDEFARRLVLDYGRTWVDAARDEQGQGRIRGFLPARIDWPDGRAVGTHGVLPSMRATHFHLLACYALTRDQQFLEPVRTLLRTALVEWARGQMPWVQCSGWNGPLGDLRSFTRDRFARREGPEQTQLFEQLAVIALLYRQLTGDRSFDDALARWTVRVRDSLVEGRKSYVFLDPDLPELWLVDRPLTVGAYLESRCAVGAQLYLGWQVTGDEDFLARVGWNLSSCLTDKWGPFTYWFYDDMEPRVTSNDHLAHKIQYAAMALAWMYTGGPGPVEGIWPGLVVTWAGVDETFCALVREADQRRVRVSLYSFGTEHRKVTARFWSLAEGKYRVRLVEQEGDRDASAQRRNGTVWTGEVVVQRTGTRRRPVEVTLPLPARRRLELIVCPTGDVGGDS